MSISKGKQSDLAEDEFVVSRIAGMKTQGRNRYYLIEWEGYELEDNTWEQENNVYSDKAIKTFIACYEAESKTKVKQIKSITKKVLLANTYDPDTGNYYKPKIKFKSILKAKTVEKATVSSSIVKCKKRTRESIETETESVLVSKPVKEARHAMEKISVETEKAFGEIIKSNKGSVKAKYPIVKVRSDSSKAQLYSISNLKHKVTILNEIDSEIPDFIYIDELEYTDPVQPPDPDFLPGCSCKSKCRDGCHDGAAYDVNGCLIIDQGTAIYECNQACECDASKCNNRVVQKGRQIPLQVFKTPNKGWGVRSMSHIRKGSFVEEYIGEVITVEEGDTRGLIYDKLGCSYLFDMDFAQSELPTKHVIDSYALGNVSRFFNHSCSPNLEVYAVFYDSADNQMHRLAFFAKRDIQKNEELCFDYNGRTDVASQKDIAGAARYSCRCQASKCRKWIYQ